jgi:type IV pilus assembly protein PilC
MSIKIPQNSKAQYKAKDKKEDGGQMSQIMAFLNKDIKFFKSKFSDKKKERFYSDLHILLSSGIDIKSAIELMEEEQKKDKDKQIFKSIKEQIIRGGSLSDAVQKSGLFSNYEYYSLKIGEESGRIIQVLEELVTFYNKKIKQKRQIVNAFSYPILVLITAVGAVLFMMNTIVPMFKDIFKRFNSELPSITQFVMDVSEVVGKYSGMFFIALFIIIIVLVINKKKTWYRKYASWVLLHLPLISPIIKMIYLSRFSQSMALLIASKTPMLQAINLVKNMMDFYPYEKALEVISEDIMRGKALNESMRQFPIFDTRTSSLVKVAEEVNQLDTIFEKLNKQFSDELEHRISIISSLLEPIMIIFVGVLVGVILVSMYLPMFQLGTSIYGQ